MGTRYNHPVTFDEQVRYFEDLSDRSAHLRRGL
jgi:hypothetical protein